MTAALKTTPPRTTMMLSIIHLDQSRWQQQQQQQQQQVRVRVPVLPSARRQASLPLRRQLLQI